MVKQLRLDVANEGLEQFFSPLEARIMELLWERGKMTTSQISKELNVSLSSVGGTLDRLVKTGYVGRTSVKEGTRFKYVYSPAISKDEFAESVTDRILSNLIETFGEIVVDNFYKKIRGSR
jgi:predicted transcriptional regulator